MSPTDANRPAAITLDQLIALNDEIAGLVRAGVPLEPALGELSRDLPGRLGRIAAAVAERSSRGEPLQKVIAEHSTRLPPVYRAVVEAGLRTGRLPAALESLATSMRQTADARRSVTVAALYPLLILAVAWGLFAFFAHSIAPRMVSLFADFNVPGRDALAHLVRWGVWAGIWGPLLPIVLLLLAGAWWYGSARANMAEPRWAAMLLGWLPWMRPTLRSSHAATFAEILAVLIESRVPLDEALVLAGEASGNRQTRAAAARMASAIARGEPNGGNAKHAGFPPLLTWLMVSGQAHGALLPALKHAAETYRRRAVRQADLARVFLPVLLTLAIGGTATLCYALMLFIPYTSMLKAIAEF